MILVDSCGWLEYFADSINAENFAPAIQNHDLCIISVISLFEVYRVLYRQVSEAVALSAVAHMQQFKVINMNSDIALAAGVLSLEHKLPFADAVILATSQICGAELYTQDNHFQHIQNVRYFEKRK